MSIEAFILIGGHSSRLGRDKAFVNIGESTLADLAINAVSQALDPSKMSLVARDAEQAALAAARYETAVIVDAVADRGPLGGLHTALLHTTADWIFLLACDFPFIAPAFLSFLHGLVSDEFGAIVPRQPDGRLQPLCAFYNVEAAAPLVAKVISDSKSSPPMHDVVTSLGPRIVLPREYPATSTSTYDFTNINTPDDLHEAVSRG